MARSVYDIIKKQNGEAFAQGIRRYDSGIFDIPDLPQLVKYAGRNPLPILPYLESLKNIKIEEHTVLQSPFELLKKAGYNAYYADTLEKQNAIRPYFQKNEELCTFRDNTRFENYFIINAVKENVDQIKRADFSNPKREDAYGTSVISIQILKSGGFISIKNRYNHTVENPDNTFRSNPDNIIPGLSEALRRHFHVDFSSFKADLPDGYVQFKNHILNYHHEIGNTYIGPDYYARNGKIYPIQKDYEILFDNFILNTKDNSVRNIVEYGYETAQHILTEEFKGKTIRIQTNEQGHKCVYANDVQILEINKEGELVGLNLPNTTEIKDKFLYYNKSLKWFRADHLTTVGNHFLASNTALTELTAQNLTTVGNGFLFKNAVLKKLTTPNLTTVGDDFLSNNEVLTELTAHNLTTVGDNFLFRNTVLTRLNLPNLITVGNNFLFRNEALTELNLQNLTTVGDMFLYSNEGLIKFSAPNLTTVGNGFLFCNTELTELNLQNLTTTGNDFLFNNEVLAKLIAPQLTTVGLNFLNVNKYLEYFYAHKLNINKDDRTILEYHPKRKKLINQNMIKSGIGLDYN